MRFFSENIKKMDLKSEVCQDVLDFLTATFRDSHFCMQAQFWQHCPPSNDERTTFFFTKQKKTTDKQNIFIVEGFTVRHYFHLYIKKFCLCLFCQPYFLSILFFWYKKQWIYAYAYVYAFEKFYQKSINICICRNSYLLKHKYMHSLKQFP